MRNRTSDLRISHFGALPLSHREVHHEVHMTRVLQTAGINNVDNAMFVNKIREMVTFELGKEIEEVFRLVTTVGQRKNSESP